MIAPLTATFILVLAHMWSEPERGDILGMAIVFGLFAYTATALFGLPAWYCFANSDRTVFLSRP